MFFERNIPLERENVYQFVKKKKKLEGPGTIISQVKISHNTQRAWVVGYAARARLAVYRIGLA